jgi:hypothetical protein
MFKLSIIGWIFLIVCTLITRYFIGPYPTLSRATTYQQKLHNVACCKSVAELK